MFMEFHAKIDVDIFLDIILFYNFFVVLVDK
jgi:hypothetical protein